QPRPALGLHQLGIGGAALAAGWLEAPLAHECRPLVEEGRVVGQLDPLDDPVTEERRDRPPGFPRPRPPGPHRPPPRGPQPRATPAPCRSAGRRAPASPRWTAMNASISRSPSNASRA